MKRNLKPSIELFENRFLLSITASDPINISASTLSSAYTWRTVATFTADNMVDLTNQSYETYKPAFWAVIDMGDGVGANLLNQNPIVVSDIGPTDSKFNIEWGHDADVVTCMLTPNADYTEYSVDVAYKYLTPGTYNWDLVIMAADGSSKTIAGTANITGPQQSQGGHTYNPPVVTDSTVVDWDTLWA